MHHTATVYILTGSCAEAPTTRDRVEIEDQEGQRNIASRHAMEEELNLTESGNDAVIRALRSNNLRLVSDGSVNKAVMLGTAAWVFASDRQVHRTGNHVTPGEANAHCSHRSEMSGILDAVLQTNDLCNEYEIESGFVELRCDGKGAIDVVNSLYQTTNPNRNHFDIISSLAATLKASPLTWTFKHVPGHQDDLRDICQLNNWEYLNTIADVEAKSKLQRVR